MRLPQKNIPIVSSWSGGKDSCLALHHAVQNGAEPKALLSMLDETGERSRSHGLPLEEIFKLDYHAIIVVTQADKLGKEYIGERLTPDLITKLEHLGIDPCGENGEYHTVVVDGPIFSHAVELRKRGAIQNSGYWFLDLHTKLSEAD